MLLLNATGGVGGEADTLARRRAALAKLAEQRLDLGVRVESRDLVLEDEVRSHAAAREVPDAFLVLGAVGVAVEVPHAAPSGVLEQLHEEERGLRILTAEPEVLVEAAGLL